VGTLQDQLENIVATGVPGVVAVAVAPAGRVEGAAGLADARTGEVLTVDHRFRIGSVTKIFVAAFVLKLVAEGLLDLDGDAAPIAEGMTIRQLLNHTSGLPRSDCARGYLPPDNPILPGEGPDPVDVTEIDVPFHRAGGGVVSTADEIAQMLRALLGGRFLSSHLRAQMLRAVDSDWPETDRYGLGIGEITALMGQQRSPCGPAWGHLGFSLGYTAMALSSNDGERQVVIWANVSAASQEAEDAFWDAAGRLAWHLYCPDR
jgi:CubicO group peptidase (beta-lactamase class C family)